MQVYVSIDMEGVAGVVHADQVRRGGHDYERARGWMTGEAEAAIRGAKYGAEKAGARAEVLVNDAHGDMRNLLLDALDQDVSVISGSLKPGSMVAGAAPGQSVALFVGYHAGAGTAAGILDHTYYGRGITDVRVGGVSFDEAALNATVIGEMGIPLGLVTGDETVCAAARERFGDIETVAVKAALGRYAARTLHPAKARGLIESAAARAVARAREGAFTPFRPAPPHAVEVDLVNSGCADAAALVPGTRRIGGRTVAYEAQDAATLLQVIRAWIGLASTTLG